MQSSRKVSAKINLISDSQLRFNTVGDIINFTIRPGIQWNTELFSHRASFAFLLGFMRLPSEVERRPTLQYVQDLAKDLKFRLRYEFRSYEKEKDNAHRFRVLLGWKRSISPTLDFSIANELNFNTYRNSDDKPLRGFDKNRLSMALLLRHNPLRPSIGPIYEYLPKAGEDEQVMAVLLSFHI